MSAKTAERTLFGDFQTPLELARAVTALAVARGPTPRAVLEPTCGRGAFLLAAQEAFPSATLVGFDTNAAYVKEARAALGREVRLAKRDFFAVRWDAVLARLPKPLLVLGNPPWVTNAAVGRLGGTNLPEKTNVRNDTGLEAITGASNFDISEWMIRALLRACHGKDARLVMLCKSAVARRIVAYVAAEGLSFEGALHAIDSQRTFEASVDAVVLSAWRAGASRGVFRLHTSLGAEASRAMAVVSGVLTADMAAFARTAHLARHEAVAEPAWRSGVKHDAAKVMELRATADGLVNGMGERVTIEPDIVFPFLKGSDVANGRAPGNRALVVPQRSLADDTTALAARAPEAYAYLCRHRAAFDARKSRVYEGRGPFAVFGIGPYSFAPYKVAICGLYKRLAFRLVGPHEGRPVLFDDTVMFLPFATQDDAERAHDALMSPEARAFFEARVFWDAKRPLGKALLASLSLPKLLAALAPAAHVALAMAPEAPASAPQAG